MFVTQRQVSSSGPYASLVHVVETKKKTKTAGLITKPHFVYAQADLKLCCSHIPHCWKSHVAAQLLWMSTFYNLNVQIFINGDYKMDTDLSPLTKDCVPDSDSCFSISSISYLRCCVFPP